MQVQYLFAQILESGLSIVDDNVICCSEPLRSSRLGCHHLPDRLLAHPIAGHDAVNLGLLITIHHANTVNPVDPTT